MPLVELGNKCWHVAINEKGLLVSLRNLRTGQEYVSRPAMDLWRLIVECDEDPEMPIDSTSQTPRQIVSNDERIEVRYRGLLARNGEQFDIEFAYSVAKGQDEEEMVFRSALTSHEQKLLKELWFPIISGLRSLGECPENDFLLYPESAGRKVRDPVRNIADRDAAPVRGVRPLFLREYYPGKASMQWMGFYGDRGSLYVGSHDDSLQTTALLAGLDTGERPEDDSIHLAFIKYPFIRNASWHSEPFVVAVHGESWHRDSRRYRRWADTYQDHAGPRPDWVRRMPGMHDIILLYQHGRINYRYDEIDKLISAVHAGGLDVLKISGWSHGGHDSHCPDFLPSERLGGEGRLIEAIREAQRDGIRVVLYFHFVQMSPNSQFYARHGEFCAMKGPHGNPHIDIFTWPSHGTVIAMNSKFRLINACVGTEPWQEQVMHCVERGLRYGADCVFLDQTAGAPGSYLCFDQRHGHPSPALAAGPGKVELSRKAREKVKSAGAEIALGAEYICDVILQFYDFSLPFGLGFFHGPPHFGEMYRYTFPEDILMTQYVSGEDYRQLNYSFVMGYRFFIAPHQQTGLLSELQPEFVEHVRALAEFRRANADVLLESTFVDDTLFETDNGRVLAKGYLRESDARAAVILWNPTGEVQDVEVNWPGAVLSSTACPLAGPVFDGNRAKLKPEEIAVFFFRTGGRR